MTTATYSVTINRRLEEFVDYLNEIDSRLLPSEGGLSFETIRGGTRIYYTTSRGVAGFFKLADSLIALITRRDAGRNVPEVIFES